MSDYKDENGEWRHGASGEKLNVHDYQGGPANANSASSAASGAWMNNLFLAIIFIVPILCAKLAGFIFALLSKLGIVGRILQTIFVAMVCPVIVMMIIAVLFGDDLHKIPNFIAVGIMTASFILPAIWYFIWHYHTVKQIGASEYSNLIKLSFIIAFFGYIIAVIVGMVGAKGFGVFLTLGVTFAVFFLYFKGVKPYAEAAKDIEVHPKAKLAWLIGLAVVAGITVLVAVSDGISAVGSAIKKGKADKEVTAPQTP